MRERSSKLILLEGLPGSGKSTNSRIIMTYLDQKKQRIKWVHEVARPHPTLFFNEACLSFEEYKEIIRVYPELKSILESSATFRKKTIGIDLLHLEWNYADKITDNVLETLKSYDVWNFPLHKYIDTALEKWEWFAEFLKHERDLTVLLDSSIFQFQIYTFLGKNTPYDRLEEFIQRLFSLISDLQPMLVYLYRENVEDAISNLENERGTEFFQRIWERDRHQTYYQNRPAGAEGYRVFLRDYHNAVHRLFLNAPVKKIGIEISDGDWDKHVSEMLAFLELNDDIDFPNVLYPVGKYKNKELNLGLEILEGAFIDPSGKQKGLIPRSGNEFYIEDLPVILRYEKPDKVVIEGEEMLERWTTKGTEFLKVKQADAKDKKTEDRSIN